MAERFISEIPITAKALLNADQTAVVNSATEVINGVYDYVDGKLAVKRRWGLSQLVDLGTDAKIDGLFWWNNKSSEIEVSGGYVKKITANDGTNTDLTDDSLDSGTRCTFAIMKDNDSGTEYLFIANGVQIVYTDGTNDTK